MDNITSRAESKRYVQSTSQNSLPNNLELDFWHFYSLAFQLGLSLFCNYKVLKMVSKSLGNSPNSSKNSVATLNQLKNVVQTGDRQQTQCSALCFASWSRHMMRHFCSMMALLLQPSYVSLGNNSKILPKNCNIQIIQLQICNKKKRQ